MQYEWAPSAVKHGVSKARARHVVETAAQAFPILDEDGDPDPDVLLYLGDDPNGVPLEVVVRIVSDEVVQVFHAMKMRAKYRSLYEQVSR